MTSADEAVLPKNWPHSIQYLRQLSFSPAILPAALKILNTPTAATAAHARLALTSIRSPNPLVIITPISSVTHPARGEHGLFAARNLLPSTFILPYIGHVHSDAPSDTDATSRYDISLDRELGLAVDAAKAGNEARFVNDYRRVAERPNAEFKDCWVQVGPGKWERWIGIFVLSAGKAGKRKTGIRAGEEILVSYGKNFWKGEAGEAVEVQAVKV
ncbi:hypothetical protein MBLNU459_g7811t1 [Dothideomycetes sp. NU459]